MDGLAHEISLASTIPALWLAAIVLRCWGMDAIKATFATHRKSAQWMVIGVAVGFFGGGGDQTWWGLAWMFHYLETGVHGWWFDNGVISNIFMRQLSGLISAFCHIQAFAKFSEEKGRPLGISPIRHLVWSSVFGVVFVICLHWYKSTL